MELVSIIIPHYNRTTYLKETLNSLLIQTYTYWEAIVVDDGSLKDEYNRLKELCEKDSRIKLFSRTEMPKGAPHCRNIGMDKAAGKYLLFLDSDDLLAKNALRNRIEKMQQNPTIDYMVFLAAFLQEKAENELRVWNVLFSKNDDLTRFLKDDAPWWTSSTFWQIDAARKVGYWQKNALSYQDWDFHVRALIMELSYKKFNIIDCYYRQNSDDQISHKGNTKEHILSRVNLFNNACELLESEKKLSPERKKWIAGRFFVEAEISQMENFQLSYTCFSKPIEKFNLLSRRDRKLFQIYYNLLSWSKKRNFNFIEKIIRKVVRYTYPKYFVKRNSNTWNSIEKKKNCKF